VGKWRRVWRSSEALAAQLLEELGYKIVGVHEKIMVEGVEIGEVDIVAEKNGEKYAVEVKAGSLDVSGVRQACVNARLLGAKPLVVSRGVDEKARVIARELGVELLVLPDLVVASPDDVRAVVTEAVLSAIEEVLGFILKCTDVLEDEEKVLEAIAFNDTIQDASKALGLTVEELAKTIARLSKKGVVPRGSYRLVRLAARIMVSCRSLMSGVPRP